jgi:hypothetical protein
MDRDATSLWDFHDLRGHDVLYDVLTRRDPSTQTPRRNSSSNNSRDKPNVLKEVTCSDGREYVVFQTQPFVNPWDIGSMENLRTIMGNSMLHWFLPFQMSPCIKHHDVRGQYGWSREVIDMAHSTVPSQRSGYTALPRMCNAVLQLLV